MIATSPPTWPTFLGAVALAVLLFTVKPAAANLPAATGEAGTDVRLALEIQDVLLKPHGWIQFDNSCVIGRSFSETLFRAKERSGRVVIREFRGLSGNPYRRAFPTVLGLDCVPYSVGYD